MAKRRNAPALFELLRDSNSTRSGQIGGEQLRAQIGGGMVPNAVPKPPNHPSLKSPPPETPEQNGGLSVPVAGQVASEAVVESKEVSPTVPPPAALDAPEAAPLAAMPSFRAGRSVPTKPEAKPESKPDAKIETPPEAKPETKPEPKPEPKAVRVAPPVVGPEVPKAEPKPVKSVPAPKAEPKVEREPFAKPAEQPSDEDPKAAEVESEGVPGEASEALPLLKRQGNQLTVSTFAVGTAATACLLLLLVAYLVGTAVGNSQGKSELEPMVRNQADTALQAPEGQGIPSIGTREDRPIDPMRLSPDPQVSRPIAVTPPAEQAAEEAKPEAKGPETVQVTNEDTRVPGQNYLHLAPLADSEEALRLQAYFAQHGIATHIREQFRGGRLGHEIITLVGIPSEEWSTSTKKIEHEREVKRLGGLWFRDFGGSIDFSRDNQSVWYKAKADGS